MHPTTWSVFPLLLGPCRPTRRDFLMTDLTAGYHPPPEPLVLVVDDDADMRAYLRRCLGPITHRVREAADGVEALAVARAALPDGLALIIVDRAMPRMGGLDLHAALRASSDFTAVAVLFISGEPGPVPEGVLLAKPFNARTLRAAVHAALPTA